MTVNKAACVRAALLVSLCAGAGWVYAETRALTLRATTVGVEGPSETLRIELLRWSTEGERKPLLTAASAPPPAPAAAPGAAPAGGRAGRAGRGRGGREAEPPNPLARLTAAVKAAPTVGFIWGAGVTGYSIKYAWRAPEADGGERIVLVTDRRLGSHSLSSPGAPAPSGRAASAPPAAATAAAAAEFTVLEMRIDGKGRGEGKMSLNGTPFVDAAAQTLAVDGYAAMPALLKVEK